MPSEVSGLGIGVKNVKMPVLGRFGSGSQLSGGLPAILEILNLKQGVGLGLVYRGYSAA
tara:strand:+ start:1199 stop:1375 length:177 start_codon:yes stop_codon:yes gene_type:complete